jgi:hypothetical protein
VALPLLGYFFCMIAVLTATAVATISFFSTSTSERVHHYPRPVIERNITTPTNREPRLFMVVPPNTKDASNTEDVSPTINTEPASLPTKKAEVKKSGSHKPKVFARLRNNYERPGYYGNRTGYAQETQYGQQRPFSNW